MKRVSNTELILPLVSVIIPAFNHEKYVIRCLQSLIEDGYPNLEVLLIDDGSKDKTYDIARNWIDEYGGIFQSTYLGRQENQGITPTLNTLINLSRGEYITLLASDDYLLPNGINARLNALNAHPEWLAVIGDCIVVDDLGDKKFESGISDLHRGNKKFLANLKLIRKELLLRWSVPGPVLLLRREAFDLNKGVGKYDETFGVEDRDFYLRLLAKNALGFIDTKVSAYRVHGNNLSASQSDYRSSLLFDLGAISRKNMMLFSGIERVILLLQSLALNSLAIYIDSGSLLAKVTSRLLWHSLGLIYFSFIIITRVIQYKK